MTTIYLLTNCMSQGTKILCYKNQVWQMHIHWGLVLFSPEPSPQRSLHSGAYCQGARFELSLLLKSWPLQSKDINAGRTAAKGFLQQTSQITIQRNFSKKKQQSLYFRPFIIYSSNHRMQGDSMAITKWTYYRRGSSRMPHTQDTHRLTQRKPERAGSIFLQQPYFT